MEWIKKNEALLIAELETRRQAGLPIQVVVRVEKITPSMPEYCEIIPDICHLEVIKEETSASDEDPKKEILEYSTKISEENNLEKLPIDRQNIYSDKENQFEIKNIPEVDLNEIVTSECLLERLESPSLVRESEIVKFADIITNVNECVTKLETFGPLNKLSINVVDNGDNVEDIECVKQESWDYNNLCSKTLNNYCIENDLKNNKIVIQDENIEDLKLNDNIITNYSNKKKQLITNELLSKDKYDDNTFCETLNSEKNYIDIHCEQHVNNLKVLNVKKQQNINSNTNNTTQIKHKCNTNIKKYKLFSKNEPNVDTNKENMEHELSSGSDDSTIKQYDINNHKTCKKREQNKISINDKLKQIARLLQDDTDDYEEIQSSQTNSRCVSIVSDADVDTDWMSFTLSDGESSKSLCLSPSQLRSGNAPSTVSETSEIIDLHKKFQNRMKSPILSPHREITPVEILSFNESQSSSPSKSYCSEVLDEACRMCGASDEPFSDAERLVSLRKYRETRSRLLDVIQKEQQLNRSVINPPSSMSMFIDTLSVPDNHTRELMYTEYMEKVKERENRLHNKVIRITKASRPLSSGTLQVLNDIDAEFVTKARERLEKLGVGADVDSIEVKDEYYPKHLVDIVPEEEVCIEEVQMNGESSGLSVCTFLFFFFLYFVLLT